MICLPGSSTATSLSPSACGRLCCFLRKIAAPEPPMLMKAANAKDEDATLFLVAS